MSSTDITSTPVTGMSLRRFNDSRSRTRGLSNIDPKFTSQSGLCSSTDLETSRGSIRIQHLTALSNETGASRFPRIEDCAHFHYEYAEIGPIEIELLSKDDELRSLLPCEGEVFAEHSGKIFTVNVTSLGKSWTVKRSLDDFYFLDKQTHQCIYDRKFSRLSEIPRGEENFRVPENYMSYKDSVRQFLSDYLRRFSSLAGPVITCGPVLNWFDLDNRGHRLIVTEDCAINTPAVAAAYAVKRYAKQASDEISFEVGDMISVIDMPPPEESIWWRGKRGFEVGFFPCECVEVIGDKVPHGLNLPATNTGSTPAGVRKISSTASSTTASEEDDEGSPSEPTKPVLRKHGKLISFFRSFILSRPARGKLKKSGILKERVFGCDLSEHLLNTGQEIPKVLYHCAEFIETKGIIDGIYRLSGIASNIQKLRVTFDEDRVPDLYNDKGVLQDIHCVSSLLKMYFRELPNPICTYHLYEKFVEAAKSNENQRLVLLRDVVQQLPPPNYRTLEYLSRHLYRVSLRGNETGMTAKNVAIVWAPNLLRCKSLEVGGVAALQGVGVQAVVTEYLIRYCELIFSDKMPSYSNNNGSCPQEIPKKSRPKSLAISTPTKLLSLEEARSRALASGSFVPPEQRYIDVGGGPENLPPTYHTVIDLPGVGARKQCPERASTRQRKSPVGWKAIFTGSNKVKNKSSIKISDPELMTDTADTGSVTDEALASTTASLIDNSQKTPVHSPLRPVKSAESLIPSSHRSSREISYNSSRPNSEEVGDEVAPLETVTRALKNSTSNRESPKCHSRSSSHDSYFERQITRRKASIELESPPDPKSSSLDLSEIQVNFELEENEMKIFSEDEEALMSTSFASDLSRSPLMDDEDGKPSFYKRVSRSNSRKSEKSRTPSFKENPQLEESLRSPELLKIHRSKNISILDTSPKKKKSDFTPGTSPNSNLVKRSKMEIDDVISPSLINSPSIKFIDDRPPSPLNDTQFSEIMDNKNDPSEIVEDISMVNKEPIVLFSEEQEGSSRLSATYSTEDESSTNCQIEVKNPDTLVVAQIHHVSIISETSNFIEIANEELLTSNIDEVPADLAHAEKPSQNLECVEKLSLQYEASAQMGISSPTETSFSIAGATVSENESFSLPSFDDDLEETDEKGEEKEEDIVTEDDEESEEEEKENIKIYTASATVTSSRKESDSSISSKEILIRPYTHESVIAMEIDEDSNITFIKDSVMMDVEENKEVMMAIPVKVLEDEEEDERPSFGYEPIQSSSQASSTSSSSISVHAPPPSSSTTTTTSSSTESSSPKPKPSYSTTKVLCPIPYSRSNSVENRRISLNSRSPTDGRQSSQGIPELEPKIKATNLFFASKGVCKSEDIGKKSGSCFSKKSNEEEDLEETPLVRRNSIHNVPYVDVNDPGTRERMERYKEERRSLLRAKYKVEDYKISNSHGSTSNTANNCGSFASKRTTTSSSSVFDPVLKKPEKFPTQTTKPLEEERKPPPSPQRNNNSSGLINEDVNVKERAALFGNPNDTKRNINLPNSYSNSNLSKNPPFSQKSVIRSRSTHSGVRLDKSPVSPNKIKNIAALFEQKS